MLKRPLLALSFLLALPAGAADFLEQGFVRPPPEARARVWLHFMNGNISKVGITRDLEAMKRVGIGGFQLFDAHLKEGPAGSPVTYRSPAWIEMIRHTTAEAQRLGLDMSIHSSAGWSLTGGPWVQPAQAMRKVVWSETQLEGPLAFRGPLDRPPVVLGSFQGYRGPEGDKAVPALRDYTDTAVVAFRSLPEPDPIVSADPLGVFIDGKPTDGRLMRDGDPNTSVVLSPKNPDGEVELSVTWSRPFTARTISVFTAADPPTGTLHVSADGRVFRKLSDLPGRLPWSRPTNKTFAFEPMSLQAVKLVMKPTGAAKTVRMAELTVGGLARINRSEDKAGFAILRDSHAYPTPAAPKNSVPSLRDVQDLSSRLAPDGTLVWDVPPGRWTVLRFGHATTGVNNAPAPPGGMGLECDKLSPDAVSAYLDGFIEPFAKAAGPHFGKTLRWVLMDSAETRQQNWTPRMEAEFRARRGYDLRPYLPTLAGHIVGSADDSDRFLRDFRRTIADLIAENHYGHIRSRLATYGIGVYAEAAGVNLAAMVDQLEAKGRVDVPMGEFWLPDDGLTPAVPAVDAKEAASAAHIYGKTIAAAESFTARPAVPAWSVAPFGLKATGDLHFTAGINQFVLHQYAHQPNERRPGFTLGPFGTHFGRFVTWWEQSTGWFDYLARSQFLLQRGRFVGDILYFYGEGVPVDTVPRDKLDPPLPPGYDYDFTNAEVLLTRAKADTAGLVLKDGTRYRVLVMPPSRELSPAVMRKLHDLVTAGLVVVGPRPVRAPGLTGHPRAGEEVRALARALWGEADSEAGDRLVGAGRVVWGRPLAEILRTLGVGPDFTAEARPDSRLVYIHRQVDPGTDLYFVSNQLPRAEDTELSFRINGRRPELWHPDTGKREFAAVWRVEAGRTYVRVRFDSAGSVFVVFRGKARPEDSLLDLEQDGVPQGISKQDTTDRPPSVAVYQGRRAFLRAFVSGTFSVKNAAGKVLKAAVDPLPDVVPLAPRFTVHFPKGLGAPPPITLDRLESFTKHPDPGVRHFSGTATYEATITVPAELRTNGRVLLDLGDVKEIAELTINGRPFAVLWKPPFQVDATKALRAGRNRLTVRITNLWPNRLIRDVALPESERITWTTNNPYKKDAPLLPSGLLGPVRLIPFREVAFRP